MKKMMLGAVAFAAMASASAANAALIVTLENGPNGTIVATFEGTVMNNGDFTETATFNLGDGFTSGTLSTLSDAGGGVNITSATFNDAAFDLGTLFGQTFGALALTPTSDGEQTLTVTGTNTGGTSTFAGTLAFTPLAVPEPAAWAMMVAGFGAVGYSLRGRSRTRSRRMVQAV